MNDRIKAICVVLLLGVVVLTIARWPDGKNPPERLSADLPALRLELKDEVAEGRLTEAEAQVRLAEAIAAAHQKDKAKVKAVIPPELKALGTRLKDQVAKGELTEAEAKAAFSEARAKWDAEIGNKKQPATGSSQ